MSKQKPKYRKNLGLLLAFFVFVTLLFIISVGFAHVVLTNFVETEFNNRKTEIFDNSLRDFNEFFQERIPEVAFYQGYMDSVQAQGFADNLLRKYPFVQKVEFSDVILSNIDSLKKHMRIGQFGAYSKNTFEFYLDNEYRLIKRRKANEGNLSSNEELSTVFLKLCTFLGRNNLDTSAIKNTDLFKLFYNIQPGKISYLNIPRVSDVISFHSMILDANFKQTFFEHDFFVFHIQPTRIRIKNLYPDYYENISIQPLVNVDLSDNEGGMKTEVALPGALSDYKLSFESSNAHIERILNRFFFPVLVFLLIIYFILLTIGYLIYRNVSINNKLYQLQYDFINNLTHEFKTPVSVIKIAGNNIKSSTTLTEAEKNMYGRILDQEADKLNSLMNKLLSYAQIENKSIKFNGEFINLREFSQHICEAYRVKYPDFEIVENIKVKDELYADPVLLTSVFQNLIDNAYKYSSVDNKFLEIKIEQTKKNFVILFRDKGIGINKKEYHNIFKKFYRVKNQFNQQGSIGLGLAFCKEITEFMGGEIKVESEVNRGTTFILSFPLDTKK